MSLVGPRPHAVHAKAANALYQDVVDGYSARHRVKPGITGWAQINGWRGETDTIDKMEKRIEHDLAYIRNWDLWLDLRILADTVKTVLAGREWLDPDPVPVPPVVPAESRGRLELSPRPR